MHWKIFLSSYSQHSAKLHWPFSHTICLAFCKVQSVLFLQVPGVVSFLRWINHHFDMPEIPLVYQDSLDIYTSFWNPVIGPTFSSMHDSLRF